MFTRGAQRPKFCADAVRAPGFDAGGWLFQAGDWYFTVAEDRPPVSIALPQVSVV